MQPDTLIPGVDSPQSWNRFSYVGNNPVRFNDPTGHCIAPATQWTCPIQVSAGPPGWASIGLEVIAAVVIGAIVGDVVWQKGKESYPHEKDIRDMEGNYGATGDSFIIWRGKPDKDKQPKGCLSGLGKALKCLGIGAALEETIRQGIKCFSDGGACVGDTQPGQLVAPSKTPTPTVIVHPNSTPDFNLNLPGAPTIDPAIQFQLNQLTVTAQPKLIQPSIKPKPTQSLKHKME